LFWEWKNRGSTLQHFLIKKMLTTHQANSFRTPPLQVILAADISKPNISRLDPPLTLTLSSTSVSLTQHLTVTVEG